MTAALAVPASLEEIIQRFDATTEPFDEYAVSRELNGARAALVDLSDADKLGAWAEVLAFALAKDRHENPWNSYFGPMGSSTDADGRIYYSPDITGTPPETVMHWAERARALKHPFLKARYADLAWDMSGPIGNRKRDAEDARIAIDSYLDAIPLMAEDHDHLGFAIRALDLAVMIGDGECTARARGALLDAHRNLMKMHSRMWWYAVDRLLEDKRAGVTEAERAELVADLESIIASGSNIEDPTHFDPHEAQSAAERLIPYYRHLNKFEDIRRLHRMVGESFERFAGNADPMLAAALLQTATDEYRNAGLKEERDRTRILMQQKITAAGENLQPVEHKIEISQDEMEKFLSIIVVDDLAQSFVNISREFMVKRAELEVQVQKTLKEAPLMAHLTQKIFADDRVAAKVGSVQEDSFGRVLRQAQLAFQLVRPWLVQAFRRLFEKHDVVPQHFAGWANRHALFEDMSLLVEGMSAWARDDHVKAAHVLVPQIERGLRKIADELGIPVTKAHPTVPETSVAIGMGEILYNQKVAEALGADATLHFQALYADPRGMNLRNEIAHGLIDADHFHWHLGNLIVHSLMMLGLWKEFGQIGKKGAG